MTTLLNTLVAEAVSKTVEEAATKAQQQQQERETRKADAAHALETDLISALGEDVYGALGITFDFNGAVVDKPLAKFSDGDVLWTLYSYQEGRRTRWSVKATYSAKPHSAKTFMDVVVDTEELRQRLLAGIGIVRAKVVESRAHEEQLALEREQQRQRAEAHDAAERQRYLAAEAEEAEINAEINARKDELLAREWQWPEGVEITLYRLRWCSGAVHDSEEGLYCDYDHGFTPSDSFDEDGYVTVYGNHARSAPRILKLSDYNKPTWERIVIRSADEVPVEKRREYRHIEIADIESRYVVERQFLARSEGKTYQVNYNVDLLPQWVMDLVDSARW